MYSHFCSHISKGPTPQISQAESTGASASASAASATLGDVMSALRSLPDVVAARLAEVSYGAPINLGKSAAEPSGTACTNVSL